MFYEKQTKGVESTKSVFLSQQQIIHKYLLNPKSTKITHHI